MEFKKDLNEELKKIAPNAFEDLNDLLNTYFKKNKDNEVFKKILPDDYFKKIE
jgi:hypothetical protein